VVRLSGSGQGGTHHPRPFPAALAQPVDDEVRNPRIGHAVVPFAQLRGEVTPFPK
jgi:hypothetical protein